MRVSPLVRGNQLTAETHVVVQCPDCRAKFRVAAAHVGRRTTCPHCRSPFEVQPLGSHSPAEPRVARPAEPTYVGVNCLLCGTRLYGTLADVGKPLRCPDCRSQTKLPPPKPPRGPVVPAAMLGDQYELWEGDDQPWGSTLAATQPGLISVHCELCNTLQYASPEQVGSNLVCPDCGHATRIRAPKPVPPKPPHHEGDYELAVSEVDASMTTPAAPPIYTRLQDFESKSREEQDREISRVATNRKSRPQMPRFPLLTGWVAFLLAPGVLSRWFSLSVLLALFASLAAFAFPMLFAGFGAGWATTTMWSRRPRRAVVRRRGCLCSDGGHREFRRQQPHRGLAVDQSYRLDGRGIVPVSSRFCGSRAWLPGRKAARWGTIGRDARHVGECLVPVPRHASFDA